MTRLNVAVAVVVALTASGATGVRAQHAVPQAIDNRPDAVVDLRTAGGAQLVAATWRFSDVRIVDSDFNAPGPDLRPSGHAIKTYEYTPKAGGAAFDDSSWEVIEPAALETRRGHGKLSFNWYRTAITIPERVGSLETTGATVVFEIVVDDYAEISVDGRLPRVLGQAGGALVKGFNAPNRVVLTRDARPGQRIQLAIFGANGPLSDPPSNFIWVRSATLDFYRKPPAPAGASFGRIVRRDPALDAIVPLDAKIEKLAEGFQFTEGPVWVPDGYLLFSDPNNNTIYRWSDDEGVSVYRAKAATPV
jgi:gluconolactonase